MKRKELYSLSLKYLKSNKRMTIKSVFSLVLCMTFLSVAIFIYFSFQFGIMSRINEENTFSSISVNYSDTTSGYMNSSYRNEIENDNNIKDYVESYQVYYQYYSRYESSNSKTLNIKYPTLIIDGDEYSIKSSSSSSNLIEFYNLDHNSVYLDDEQKYMVNNHLGDVILAGNVISPDSSEVMINSSVLDELQIDYLDVIGKKLSYEVSIPMQYNIYYGDSRYDNYGDYISIFNNYTICGVFNDNIYSCPTRKNKISNPIFWINDDLVYDEVIYEYDADTGRCYYYDDPINVSKSVVEDGKVFLASYICSKPDDLRRVLYEYTSFNNAYKAYNKMYKYAILSTEHGISIANCMNSSIVLSDYIDLYPRLIISVVGSFVISIIVFIATLINMILIIDFQKRRKKHFFAMLKAIGYSNENIKNISNYQIDLQYLISTLISLVISFVINLIITSRWNNMIDIKNYNVDGNYNINIIYMLPSFIALIIVFYAVMKLIMFLYNKAIDDDSILDSLHEE